MCLITTQKEAKTTEQDITVYKILRPDFVSIFQDFPYEDNQQYETTIKQTNDWTCSDDVDSDYLRENHPNWIGGHDETLISIGEGFHSYKTLERAKKSQEGLCWFETIMVTAIIPAGSEYFEDATNGIVSSKIIIKNLVD